MSSMQASGKRPFELFKLGAQLLVLVVEPLRQWDLVGFGKRFQFLVCR
nr:hypothetical protein [Mesorhizobium sp.]